MRRRAGILFALLSGAALAGCSTPGWLRVPDVDLPDLPEVHLPSFGGDGEAPPQPAPEAGVEVLTGGAPEAEFLARAEQFYQRLTGRRFNSIATFRDEGLREYFESEQSYSDYFADLAQDLADAHFERNEPFSATVLEFAAEGPGVARVRVRLGGENGLPLRFWSTSLKRDDRWERRDGRWWIVPGPL